MRRGRTSRKMVRALRLYAAIVTGALAELTTAVALWAFSGMEIFGIAFWALIAYGIGAAAVMWATEPKQKSEHKRKEAKFYTMIPEGYEGIPVPGCPDYIELIPTRRQA